ncbi:MAG: hypothetical protein C5B50_26130 [Verrucomicrobia bacterium]|nr:MAG: hypothetical protein C5B50_26130 [Verrucomicrobiota bacterium]
MKLNPLLYKSFSMASLAMLISGSKTLGANDINIVIDPSLSAWTSAWGPAYAGKSFDSGNTAAVLLENWSGNTGGQDSYVVGTVADCNGWATCGTNIDGTQYSSIEMDILFFTTNTVSLASCCSAGFQIGFDHGYSFTSLTNFFPAYDGVFHHLSIPIPAAASGANQFYSVGFYIWQPGGVNGALTWEVKNVVVKARLVQVPPPTLSNPYKPTPGLNLFSRTQNGGGNQRTDIGVINNPSGNTWLGASGPVTYSLTITNFPDPSVSYYGNYQAQIFLTSGNFPLPASESAPDYTEASVIFVEIDTTPTGGAYASFRYKINEPQSNAGMFGTDNGTAGTLVTLGGVSTVLGTWSITFNNDTNVTLTGPGGVSTSFVFTNAIALNTNSTPCFGDPLNIFFGGQANASSLIGHEVVLSAASVTGNGNPVSDNFMTDTPPLNSSLWGIFAGDQSTVQLIPTDPLARWVPWTLPDNGFGLLTTATPANSNSWITLTGAGATASLLTMAHSAYRLAYVPSANIPSAQASFFQLVKRTPTQLQVLLPGESNAPGTVSGKSGSPIAQSVGVPFNITVNACDATWHIASSSDTVSFSSTDATANLPPNTALVNGSATISGLTQFNTAGTWTITATDVTTGSIASGASSSVTAQ